MQQLRESGQVSAIGLGVNEWQVCVEMMDEADFDCFLLAGRYTLLDQSALSALLPKCAQRGVSLIAGGVFNSGILVNGSRNAARSHYDYVAPPLEIIERVRQLESVCAEFNVELPAAALQFPLSHPQVACVLVGCARQSEVEQAAAWVTQPVAPELWSASQRAWLARGRHTCAETSSSMSSHIDSHQHFWCVSDGKGMWPTPAEGKIFRDYGPGDLMPHLTRSNIAGTVLVQVDPTEEDTQKLLAAGARA